MKSPLLRFLVPHAALDIVVLRLFADDSLIEFELVEPQES